MNKRAAQWLQQADYDMETAEFMYEGGRYFYAVFMCHLSVEKALKALYQDKIKCIPPKTHNLVYLLREIGLKPQETIGKFIVKLNEASIATRYPEELEKLQRDYTEKIVKDILDNSRKLLHWTKKQF